MIASIALPFTAVRMIPTGAFRSAPAIYNAESGSGVCAGPKKFPKKFVASRNGMVGQS